MTPNISKDILIELNYVHLVSLDPQKPCEKSSLKYSEMFVQDFQKQQRCLTKFMKMFMSLVESRSECKG